jgi:hypothetical protein
MHGFFKPADDFIEAFHDFFALPEQAQPFNGLFFFIYLF